MIQNDKIPDFMVNDTAPRLCMRQGGVCGGAVDLPALNLLRRRPLADISIVDWHVLYSAVKARLRESVTIAPKATAISPVHGTVQLVRDHVLECVDAMDQLHATWTDELDRRRQLEIELIEVTAKLEFVRTELEGTRAGETRARRLALHDCLTALPNGSLFRWRLDKALCNEHANGKGLAVLYVDLDGFKSVNDAYGHDAGDELLRVIAARLLGAVHAEDMVSRLGGDEFACILTDYGDREKLIHSVCDLLGAISAPIKMGRLTLTTRPSVGIATCPADGATVEALINNADAAMYYAKRKQVGYAFFDEHVEMCT